jgi:predicted nucleotidyltransferase
MDAHQLHQPHHQAVMNRFVAACQADERVVGAYLSGSYARGTSDAYSDLDLCLVTTDEAYYDFFASREAFIRLLREPVLLEDFDDHGLDTLNYIFDDGTEGELVLGRESQLTHIHGAADSVLLDKKGILAGAVFPWYEPAQAEQIEMLRQLEQGAMLQAALVIVRLYQELAPPLARAHGITYPADLERVVSDRLERLYHTPN